MEEVTQRDVSCRQGQTKADGIIWDCMPVVPGRGRKPYLCFPFDPWFVQDMAAVSLCGRLPGDKLTPDRVIDHAMGFLKLIQSQVFLMTESSTQAFW